MECVDNDVDGLLGDSLEHLLKTFDHITNGRFSCAIVVYRIKMEGDVTTKLRAGSELGKK